MRDRPARQSDAPLVGVVACQELGPPGQRGRRALLGRLDGRVVGAVERPLEHHLEVDRMRDGEGDVGQPGLEEVLSTALELVGEEIERLRRQRREETGLVAEVMGRRRVGDVGSAGELAHAPAVHPGLTDGLDRGVEDGPAHHFMPGDVTAMLNHDDLVVMLPANVYAAVEGIELAGGPASPLWQRVPEQVLYIAVAWWVFTAARAGRPTYCLSARRMASRDDEFHRNWRFRAARTDPSLTKVRGGSLLKT